MRRRSTAAGAIALVGGAALIAGFLTPVAATAAPSLQPRNYTYGNWAQVGSGFALGSDDTISQVYQLTSRSAFPDLASTPGPVYAAGTFINSGGTTINRVGQWNGTSWAPLTGDTNGIAPGAARTVVNGAGVPGVYGMVLGGDNSLFAGGQFTASDTTLNNVGKWNGTDWVLMGNGLKLGTAGNVVQDMVMGNDFIGGDDVNYTDDTVYAVGGFTGPCADTACNTTSASAVGIAQYSQVNNQWYPMGNGTLTNGRQVYAGAYIDDTLYVGGDFTNIGGTTAMLVAQWDETTDTWLPMDAGLGSAVVAVYAMAVHPITKDLYVGGTFGNPVGGAAGSTPGIIKWDYTDNAWYSVGTGLTSGNVDDIAFSADGTTMYMGMWGGVVSGTIANHVAVLTSNDLISTNAQAISGAWNYVKSAGAIGVSGPSNGVINQSAVRAVLAQSGGSAMFGGNFHTAGAITASRVATFTPGPEPDPNIPATPPGAPLNVVAKGGWQTVTVSWEPPTDQGTYPITNYLAQATAVGAAPAGNVCITRLTDAKLTECTFTSLRPGVQYTFTVQGLNGGGWGARSAASNAAAPYELKVTGYGRKKLSFLKIPLGSEVSAKGTSLGYPAGMRISVFVKEGDTGQWVEQAKSGLTTNASGTFSWQRKFSRSKDGTPISVQFGIGTDRSNAVRIPAVK
jgi:hypothetical protein